MLSKGMDIKTMNKQDRKDLKILSDDSVCTVIYNSCNKLMEEYHGIR